MKLSLVVDGYRHELEADPRKLLVEVLREDLSIASARIGCLTGDCGACTIRVDGAVRKSCLILAASADGAEITTVVAADATMDALKRSFVRCAAFQCGFCTPGMIMVAADLLADNRTPSEAEIRDALTGNLCRCTGYEPIVAAVRDAAGVLRGP